MSKQIKLKENILFFPSGLIDVMILMAYFIFEYGVISYSYMLKS
jgi:hypothetical protein